MCESFLKRFKDLYQEWLAHSPTCQVCKGAAGKVGPLFGTMAKSLGEKLGMKL